MRYLKLFEVFNNDLTINIFDFDDTLVKSPKFEDMAINFLKESLNVESILQTSLSYINKNIKDIKIEHGRLFIPDPDQEINVKGNWIRRKSRVYFVTPNRYYLDDISLPKEKLPLCEFYNNVKNKAIVTGRSISMEPKIKKVLNDLNIEFPNYGLWCYPTTIETRVSEWKAKTIIDLIKKNGFTKANFYEDNSKWLKTVNNIIKKELPNIEWQGIKT